MHDIRFIREHGDEFDKALKRRGLPGASKEILEKDAERRRVQTLTQEAQAKRNELSKQIGEVKRQKGNADELMQQVAQVKDILAGLEEQEKKLGEELNAILSAIPNLPAADVPDGASEKDNKEIRKSGAPKNIPGAKEHFDIGEKLGLMDFATAAKLSGARFTILKGPLARLERALGDFMLDIHTREFGYTEISPPLMVRDEIMYGTGQLPKFVEDQFWAITGEFFSKRGESYLEDIARSKDVLELQMAFTQVLNTLRKGRLALIPTAEVPLTNMVYDSITEREKLPLRVTAKTPCFRAEAGAAGKDTRGMLRQHQFYKVEMVSITAPEQSNDEHERMTECAETVLKRLELPFRTVVLCTGDMGFSVRKTYDIEVWLPGQKTYREVSSCSNCGDFQARRMNARCKKAGDKATEFVHTLNGSGVALGRCLIAIMENFQEPDGSIIIPPALRPYMGGAEKIG